MGIDVRKHAGAGDEGGDARQRHVDSDGERFLRGCRELKIDHSFYLAGQRS